MVDRLNIRQVICGHQWSSLSEWASAIDALAELSDQELENLAQDFSLHPSLPAPPKL